MNILTKQFENASIRSVVNDDGSLHFVARDVLAALDYSESSLKQVGNALAHIPEIWKTLNELGPTQGETWTLTEQGLYFFLGRSNKAKALPFQMWLAGEVLPAIRRDGYYLTKSANVERLEADLAEIKKHNAELVKMNSTLRVRLDEEDAYATKLAAENLALESSIYAAPIMTHVEEDDFESYPAAQRVKKIARQLNDSDAYFIRKLAMTATHYKDQHNALTHSFNKQSDIIRHLQQTRT